VVVSHLTSNASVVPVPSELTKRAIAAAWGIWPLLFEGLGFPTLEGMRGLRRAALLTWRACADATIAPYEAVRAVSQ
jgi:hypothetical protein